ncbi:MAG: cyclase family protein [Phycisphaeraceae bacterium]|nr:cyclase family protein [Phycisphaeraceae bacterium]MCB9848285.1 cyclase family protein [Phycisphaeraceae bacterium]
MAERIIDISPAVSPRLAVWPGDTPLSREVLSDIGRGDAVTLSSIHATAHLGAHADAPNHYVRGGEDIAARALGFYLGACQVIAAPVARGARVGFDDLRDEITESRVLFATGTFPDPDAWNDDFAGVEPALIDDLADRGVRTIGIDTPSVDVLGSDGFPAHDAVARRDMAILEGLILTGVAPGRYELIALPLKLEGFDASPVRAVLRTYAGE